MIPQLPTIEQMEVRRLLSVVWTQGFTNMIEGEGTFSSYYMWFKKEGREALDHPTPDNWMQDYSWLGKGFEPVTLALNGAPAVKYVGVVPYVVDPAAMKKWSVKEFLAEYPRAFDRFPKHVIPMLDWFMVETDEKTGAKTLKAGDFMFNYGPQEGQHGAISGWDGGTLDSGRDDSKLVKDDRKATQKAKHKKKAHRHHKQPKHTESVFLDRRFGTLRR